MYSVPLCLQYMSGKAMVYSLPYSQVKPTRFFSKPLHGKFFWVLGNIANVHSNTF